MYKNNHIDEELARRKRIRKIKSIARIFVYIVMLLLITTNIWQYQENKALKQQIKELMIMVTADREEIPEPVRGNFERSRSLGEFKISHYCACKKCCGKNDGITATGTRAREGHTIAVDPEVIPLGSEVIIEGKTYIAEDTGGSIKGNKIDIYVASHQEALRLGIKTAEVFKK